MAAEPNSLLREIARNHAGLDKRIKRLERMRRLSNASMQGGRIIIYDEDGNIRVIIGTQDDGSITIVDLNGTPPPKPSLPTIEGLPGAIAVTWDGLTASGDPWPADFRRVEVHLSATEGFTSNAEEEPLGNETHAASFSSARGGVVTIPSTPGGVRYVALVAENTSGVNGPVTAEQSAAALDGGFEPTEPPASSPTLEVFGMPNSIVLRAASVHASTQITYQVSTDQVTWIDLPGGPTRTTVTTVREIPGVGPFEDGEFYYFRTVASNAAGEAIPSPSVTGSLDMSAVADLIAETLTAEAVFTGRIEIGQGRWTADEGIVIPQPDDGVIRLPVDGSAAHITAEFIARSLIVENGADLFGTSSLSGVLRLADSVNDPGQPPVLSAAYPAQAVDGVEADRTFYGLCRSLEGDGWVTVHKGTSDTVLVRTDEIGTILNSATIPDADGDIGGVVAVGSRYYVLKRAKDARASSTGWRIQPFSDALVAATTWPALVSTTSPMTIGTDGTRLLLAHLAGNRTRVNVAKITAPASGTGSIHSQVTLDDANMPTDLSGIYFGAADFGADRWVVQPRQADVRVYGDTPSGEHAGGRIPASEWPRPFGHKVAGLAWDGAHFWAIDSWGVLRRLAGHGLGGVHHWAYVWVDSDTHTTGLSPRVAYNRPARSHVRVNCNKAPQVGEPGVHVADRVLVYASATDTGPAYPQGTALTAGTAAATIESITLTGTPAGTNNWASVASPGTIEAGIGGFWFDGASNGSIGTEGFHDDVVAAVAAYFATWPHSERKSAGQTLADDTTTAVEWATLITERGSFTPTASSTKWTVPAGQAGTYEVEATVSFDGDGDGRRVTTIEKNGVIQFRSNQTTVGATPPTHQFVSGSFDCVAGDEITVSAYHNAGNSLAVSSDSRVTVRRKP